MKIHPLFSEILIFSLVVLFIIFPPFFTVVPDGSGIFSQWNFTFQPFMIFCFCLVLYFLTKKIIISPFENKNENFPTKFFLHYLFPLIYTLCLLFAVSFIIKGISILISTKDNLIIPEKPEGILKWIFCLLSFLFSAFNEEVIYRFYFPQTLLHLFENKIKTKVWIILIEFLSSIVFAFAHMYAGWLSVINAFLCHFILRTCFLRTKSVWAGFSAHFIYNIISLILL